MFYITEKPYRHLTGCPYINCCWHGCNWDHGSALRSCITKKEKIKSLDNASAVVYIHLANYLTIMKLWRYKNIVHWKGYKNNTNLLISNFKWNESRNNWSFLPFIQPFHGFTCFTYVSFLIFTWNCSPLPSIPAKWRNLNTMSRVSGWFTFIPMEVIRWRAVSPKKWSIIMEII